MDDTQGKKRQASVAGLAVAGALLAPVGCGGTEPAAEPPPTTETPPVASAVVDEAVPDAGAAPEGDAGTTEELEPDPKKQWPNPGGVRG